MNSAFKARAIMKEVEDQQAYERNKANELFLQSQKQLVDQAKEQVNKNLNLIDVLIVKACKQLNYQVDYVLPDSDCGKELLPLLAKELTTLGYRVEAKSQYHPEVIGRKSYDEYDIPAHTSYTLTIRWDK